MYGVRRTRRHPMSSYGPAIEIGFTAVGREFRFGLWMISAVDPLKQAASNVEIPCHMLTVTLVIIGGIVNAHEKRDSIVDRAVWVTYGIDSAGHLRLHALQDGAESTVPSSTIPDITAAPTNVYSHIFQFLSPRYAPQDLFPPLHLVSNYTFHSGTPYLHRNPYAKATFGSRSSSHVPCRFFPPLYQYLHGSSSGGATPPPPPLL